MAQELVLNVIKAMQLRGSRQKECTLAVSNVAPNMCAELVKHASYRIRTPRAKQCLSFWADLCNYLIDAWYHCKVAINKCTQKAEALIISILWV